MRIEHKMYEERRNIEISGIAVAPGMAVGRAFVHQDILERYLEFYAIGRHQVDSEFLRIERAINETLEHLRTSARRVEEELEGSLAAILHAHIAILQDASLRQDLRNALEKDLFNAEHAVHHVFTRWEKKFQGMDDEILRTRDADVADLCRRVLRALTGIHGHSLERMPERAILVAQRCFPSGAVYISQRRGAGIVVEQGSSGSHCALIARQTGIPAVAQTLRLLESVSTGDLILVDGFRGTVVIDPEEDVLQRFEKDRAQFRASAAEANRRSGLPATTQDGLTVPVLANIGNRRDAEMAAENGADGVGLYRTEMMFLSRSLLPTEEELIESISHGLAPLKGKPVILRLLDVGGDKNLPYLKLPEEANPFLGRRGVRLLLDYPELLGVQLRAFLRLSADLDIRILVPMVTVAEDMKQIRAALRSAALELGIRDIPPLGAMIETPAAALSVKDILVSADFLNIGTNDLTQFAMAAARDSWLVHRYYQEDHAAVFRLIEATCRDAGQVSVGLCGELGGRLEAIPTLLSLGVRQLSVAPPLVPQVKEAVRQVRTHDRCLQQRWGYEAVPGGISE